MEPIGATSITVVTNLLDPERETLLTLLTAEHELQSLIGGPPELVTAFAERLARRAGTST